MDSLTSNLGFYANDNNSGARQYLPFVIFIITVSVLVVIYALFIRKKQVEINSQSNPNVPNEHLEI